MVATTTTNETTLMDLSPVDALMTYIGVTVLFIYPPTDKHHYNLKDLKTAFIQTLDQDYPILLGELYSDPARRGMPCVKLDAATLNKGGSAVPFVTDPASSQTTKQALKSLSYDFMPSPRKGKHQLITVKCSLLADGGLAIGIDIAHGVIDGEASFTLVKVWAQHYRRLAGIDGLDAPIKLSHDRHLLAATGSGASQPHPEFRVLPPSAPSDPSAMDDNKSEGPIPVPATTNSAGHPSTDQRILHLSPAMLARLKSIVESIDDVDGSTKLPGSPYVSTIDVLTALLTVFITRARGHGKDVRIATCVNARAHLQPPLPTNYAGNVIFFALPTYKAAELAPSSSGDLVDTLRLVAGRIRESINRTRDHQFLQDSMEFIASQSDISAVCVNTDFFFGPDIFFTSWVRTGAYDADFGGGKPNFAGLPRVSVSDGLVVITDPMHPQVDGLDVVVLLESKAIKHFDKQWEALEL